MSYTVGIVDLLPLRGCIVSANDEPCYSVYGGPWPSSELETQAIMSFLLEHKNSVAALLTVHNYGQMILSRWAYTDALYPPEHNETVRYFCCSSTIAIAFCLAMLWISAAYAIVRYPSVCLSVCHVRVFCQNE